MTRRLRNYPTRRQDLPHCGVVRRMRRRAVTHDHRNPARRNRSGRVLSAMQSAKAATRPNGGESNWTTTSLTNCRYSWQSPARRRSWASVARQRIDSPRPANFRCAGSAVASTSSPLSFESWSHRERIGLSGWHPLSAVGQTSAASTRSSQPPRRSREAFRSTTDHCLSVAAAGQQELPPPVWDTARTQQESR